MSGDFSSMSAVACFWTSLWGLCIVPKIRIFLWRLYNNILLKCKNLSRQILFIQSHNAICSEHVEDAVHIFFHYRVTAETG